MPFISKDWRSPGEEWVKTEEGWEKKKILECGRQVLFSHSENTDPQCTSITSFSTDINEARMQMMAHTRWFDENEENKENMHVEQAEQVQKLQQVHKVQQLQGLQQVQLQQIQQLQHVQPVVQVDQLEEENSLQLSSKCSDATIQPHCHITIKCTREIAGFNGLSDAFKRLDFRNAVHDVRRFNYICKLLDLLITQKLTMLSGCAQKVLFNMLEEVAYQVSASQQNIHMLHRLLRQLRVMIDCACWGRPLGSTLLWESHLRTINRILSIANRIQISEPGDEVFPKLENLPEECIREVLLRLADHKDLENSRRAYSVMARLVDEQRIWRELCQFHFTQQQISFVMEQLDPELQKDWQNIYHKLRKSFGLKEEYAEMIQLCRNCRCLFWKSIGHPCIADQDPGFQEKLEDVDKSSLHIPIPPQAFLKFFSL